MSKLTHAVIRNWELGEADVEPCTEAEAHRIAQAENRKGLEVYVAELIAYRPGRNERLEEYRRDIRR